MKKEFYTAKPLEIKNQIIWHETAARAGKNYERAVKDLLSAEKRVKKYKREVRYWSEVARKYYKKFPN